MKENEISYLIRGAIFEVYNTLGPGLLESAYETVLAYELRKLGLHVLTQVPVPLIYKDVKLDIGFRIDILVQDLVIVEIKSIQTLQNVNHKQILTHLKLSGLALGLLVNFNCSNIEANIFRKVNGLIE